MSVEMFKEQLKKRNIQLDILVSQQPTRTAQEAADVHGVPVSNIVKSLLVKVDDTFKLFLVPGDRKLDLESVKERFNASEVRMANADEVKEVTGYSIGGVPPLGHINDIEIFIEEGFDDSREVAAAAGSGNSVFKISLDLLKRYVQGH